MAPAGDAACLRAALEAGADAVYLGLPILNARRRAANFAAADLAEAAERAHDCGAKIYLTLNIDIAEREARTAAAALEMAAAAKVDAVIVRDPLFLRLRPAFPELAWHISTQAAVLNSADVRMLRDLGAQRVVLAREMSRREITAAAAVPGIEVEVFVQGALCFAISGRCLLSSWGGGLSGNRGLCCSLCRLPWRIAESGEEKRLFSMCDLCALERLPDLQAAGVKALKIEGRLKNAAWVRHAVSLYRRALAGGELAALRREAEALGDYAGRQMTCGYLDGQCSGLIAPGARPRTQTLPENGAAAPDAEGEKGYSLHIATSGSAWTFAISCAERAMTWRIRPPAIKRRGRALSLADFLAACRAEPIQGLRLADWSADDSTRLLPPRLARELRRRISAFLHACRKEQQAIVTARPRPAALALLQAKNGNAATANLTLGTPPDRVRLRAADVERFLRSAERRGLSGIIVEEATNLRSLKHLAKDIEICVALPLVFFEDEIAACQALVEEAVSLGFAVEANTWAAAAMALSLIHISEPT
ncbi:MAG: U32 family peptidase, partial [Planctomycetota bacterium]|nr:U32 family peptidase [Planctomycetota bacterium]